MKNVWLRQKVISKIFFAIFCIMFSCGVSQAQNESQEYFVEISAPTLENAVSTNLERVEEFKFIREEASKMGVRVYLFGGTAAGYVHYVMWDLLRQHGDARFKSDRFDYDFTNIYRSTQDLDIVVDGPPGKAVELQKILSEKFPYFLGPKTSWEVRLLREKTGDKLPLLNDYNFLNQNSDSNSTGLVEITKSSDPVIRDLREWENRTPYFLQDALEGKLHYYYSTTHDTTSRAREGLNPPILSVVRYLTKAFQYELLMRPEDLTIIKKIIDEFKPQSVQQGTYVDTWLEKNAPKLIQHAVNIEFAVNTMDKLGLREKLVKIHNNAGQINSMTWWMKKEPLRSAPVGQGSGRTLREILVELGHNPDDVIVAHETSDFLAYESITRSHTNEPNVLVSREHAPGEMAAGGWGHYTAIGRIGAKDTGYTVRYKPNLNARENSDFVMSGSYIIFRNKKALDVIPESLSLGLIDYIRLVETAQIKKEDTGILEKVRRRVISKISAANGDDLIALRNLADRLFKTFISEKGANVNANVALSELIKLSGRNLPLDQLLEVKRFPLHDILNSIYALDDSKITEPDRNPLVFQIMERLISYYNSAAPNSINPDQIFNALQRKLEGNLKTVVRTNLLRHFLALRGSSKYHDRIAAFLSDNGWSTNFEVGRPDGFLLGALENKEWHPYIGKVLNSLKTEHTGTKYDVEAIGERLKNPLLLSKYPDEVLADIFQFVFSNEESMNWNPTNEITEKLAQIRLPKVAQTLVKLHAKKISSPGGPEALGKYLVQNLIFSEVYADLDLWKSIPLQNYGREVAIGTKNLKNWKDKNKANEVYQEIMTLFVGPKSKTQKYKMDDEFEVMLLKNAPSGEKKTTAVLKKFDKWDFQKKAEYLTSDVDPTQLPTLFKNFLEGPEKEEGTGHFYLFNDGLPKLMDNLMIAIRQDPSVAVVAAEHWSKVNIGLDYLSSSGKYLNEKKQFLKELYKHDTFSKIRFHGSEAIADYYTLIMDPRYWRDQALLSEALASMKRFLKDNQDPLVLRNYLTLKSMSRRGAMPLVSESCAVVLGGLKVN